MKSKKRKEITYDRDTGVIKKNDKIINVNFLKQMLPSKDGILMKIKSEDGKEMEIKENENFHLKQKKCYKCEKWYDISQYQKNSYKADGLQDECKFCRKNMKEDRSYEKKLDNYRDDH